MEYAELITCLKRYSFPAKMAIAQTYSRKIYNSKGLVSPNELRKGVRPWTLETFLLLSIAAQEWKYDSFDGHDGQKIFIKIINAIENYREKPLTVTNIVMNGSTGCLRRTSPYSLMCSKMNH